MSEEEKHELIEWLGFQAYSEVLGTRKDGPYLRLDEIIKYLPEFIDELLHTNKGNNHV